MRKNVGVTDRIVRLFLGMTLLSWAIAGGPGWAYLGLYLIASGAWGVSLEYIALRWNNKNNDDTNF